MSDAFSRIHLSCLFDTEHGNRHKDDRHAEDLYDRELIAEQQHTKHIILNEYNDARRLFSTTL